MKTFRIVAKALGVLVLFTVGLTVSIFAIGFSFICGFRLSELAADLLFR